jgi:hypothetical protein
VVLAGTTSSSGTFKVLVSDLSRTSELHELDERRVLADRPPALLGR